MKRDVETDHYRLEKINAWLASEMDRMMKMPVINAIPELPDGKGQQAADVVNYDYLRVLRVLAELVPVEHSGFVNSDDPILIERMFFALQANNTIK